MLGGGWEDRQAAKQRNFNGQCLATKLNIILNIFKIKYEGYDSAKSLGAHGGAKETEGLQPQASGGTIPARIWVINFGIIVSYKKQF